MSGYIRVFFSVLFIDDNSNDGTQEILKRIKNKKIFYIFRNKKLGIGSAHKFGIKIGYKDKYRYIITLDCDGTHDPIYINKMINILNKKKFDLISTNRFLKNNSLNAAMLYLYLDHSKEGFPLNLDYKNYLVYN